MTCSITSENEKDVVETGSCMCICLYRTNSDIQIYDLKDGDIAYYILYRDNQNKFKRFKVGKKSNGINENIANRVRNEIINKINIGDDPLKHKKRKSIITLDSLADVYFEYTKDKNRDHKNSLSRYNNHLKSEFGYRDIDSITTQELVKFQTDKQKTHSDKTTNHILILLGTIYNHSIKYKGLKTINPLLKIKKLKIDNSRERYLNKHEIQELQDKLKDEPVLGLFVSLSLCTGGRVATIMNICKKDINLDLDTINLKDIKNNSSYTGYLNTQTKNMILKIWSGLKANDRIIGDYKQSTIQKKLKAVFDELYNDGLSKDDYKNRAVIHSLRHTFASHLAINGTPIFTIQKLMNHNDIKMTMRYAKLAPDSGKDKVRELYL